MLDLAVFIINAFSDALGSILNIEIPLTTGVSVYVYDIFLFIFLIFMFIKFLGVVTHNQTISRKG